MIKKLALLLVLFSTILSAKFKYQSHLLMDIHKQLLNKGIVFQKEKTFVDTLETGNYRYIFPIKKSKLGIKFIISQDSIIQHIGINIFPDENIYSRFIERCTLVKNFNLDVKNNFAIDRERTVISYNKHKLNRIIISKYFPKFLNKTNNLKILFKKKEIILNLSDTLGNNLKIITPLSFNFISGMDKKELDDYWLWKIKNAGNSFSGYDNKIDTNAIVNNLISINDSIYYLEGKNLINGLDQNIYFVKDSIKYKLIRSKNSPVLSIKNILNFPNLSKININELSFHNYPQGIVKLKSALLSLDMILSNECEKFVGFEKENDNDYVFLILYFNPIFRYSHLLSLKIGRKNNSFSSLLASGDLYTNIRNDNLNNLFKKYENRHKQFVIDIKREKKEK